MWSSEEDVLLVWDPSVCLSPSSDPSLLVTHSVPCDVENDSFTRNYATQSGVRVDALECL